MLVPITRSPLLTRRRLRGRSLILAYHNILPDREHVLGDRSLHLRRRQFLAQLDILQDSFEVVPLGALFHLAESERPLVALTFDDAYAGAVHIGLDELRRRELPSAIFVAPSMLGRFFWWDVLSSLQGLSSEARGHALTVCRGQDTAVREWARGAGLPVDELPEVYRAATENELTRAVVNSQVALGVHTWSHPNLAALLPEEACEELVRPLAWLRDRFSQVLPWIAYPYGFPPDNPASLIGSTGLEAGLLVRGGWVLRSALDPFVIPRLNVSAALSLDGFRLRLAGILAN
jgi:peptidoglycan/xylan/chitin deacetylase (PgdA/CDA1 family)